MVAHILYSPRGSFTYHVSQEWEGVSIAYASVNFLYRKPKAAYGGVGGSTMAEYWLM